MWWTPPAHAHDTSTEAGLRPFVRDGALVAAWTTTGLWVNDRGWQRVCHESLDRVNDVWLAPDGSFVLATFDGLVRATDGGCTRTPDPSRLAPLVALVPLGDRLAAVEVHADGDRLLVSTDGGGSFADVAPLPEPIDVGSVGADGDGGWWVGAGYLDPRLFWSGDGGATWAAAEVPDPDALLLEVLGPYGDGVAVAAWDARGTASVWAGPPWVRALDLPLVPTGYGCVGGACVIGVDPAAIGFSLADPEPRLVDGPVRCVAALDGVVWGCTAPGSDTLFTSSPDGHSFTGALPRGAAVERVCPAGSFAAAVCPPPAVSPAPAAPPPAAPPPGGCATSSAPVWVALLARRRVGLRTRGVWNRTFDSRPSRRRPTSG